MTAPQLTAYVNGPIAVSGDQLNTFMQTADTATQLRGLIGVSGMSIYVRGMSAINDGQGGAFYWASTSAGPDDNLNTIVPPGAKVGAWVRQTIIGGFYPIPNIAALRAATLSSAAPPVCYVEGYFSGTDGGEGMFWFAAGDTTSADNGGTIIVDSVNRRWYRETGGEPYSVKWFGAVGDGVTDDTAAIQETLNAAAVSFKPIYGPAGRYLLSAQLTYRMPSASAALTIKGDGADLTQFIWPAGQGMAINYISAFNSCHLRDFSCLIGTTGTAGQTAITLNQTVSVPNAANSALSDITGVTCRGLDGYLETDYWAAGVIVNAVSNINFISLNVAGPSAVALNNGVELNGNFTTPAVVYNFTSCYFTGVNQGIFYGSYVQGVTVSQCNFTACNFGIGTTTGELNLDELAVSDSQFECFHAGIIFQALLSNFAATGNLFIVPSNAFGIDLNFANVFMITGNSFVPDSTSVASVGIHIDANGLGLGLITGNSFLSMATAAIQLDTGTTGINVQSNVYASNGTNVSNTGTGNIIGGGSP